MDVFQKLKKSHEYSITKPSLISHHIIQDLNVRQQLESTTHY